MSPKRGRKGREPAAKVGAKPEARRLEASRATPLYLSAFVSGAAALGYQFLWIRLLSLSLGGERDAIAGTLAGFMAGMAIGSAALARDPASPRSALRRYMAMEGAMAAFGAIAPWLPALAEGLAGAFASDGAGPGRLVGTALHSLVVVMPGAACMGASFPLLVAGRAVAGPDEAGVGRIYAANTAGAVVGTLAGVYLLFPSVGLAGGAVVLALANVAALLAAGLALSRAPRAGDEPAAPGPADSSPARASLPRPTEAAIPVWALAGLTGFAALAYEVVLVHLLSRIFLDTVFTFAHLLAVYLLGAAAGARFQARRRAEGRPASAATLAGGLAACVGAAAASTRFLPDLLLALAPHDSGFARHAFGELLVGGLVFFVPSALMGALFESIMHPLAGRALSRAYAVNLLGSAIAPAAVVLWLLPRFGAARALDAIGIAYALTLLAVGGARANVARRTAAWLAVAGLLRLSAPSGEWLLVLAPDFRVVETRETSHGLLVVSRMGDGAEDDPRRRQLQINNRQIMGGGVAQADGKMGHIPLMLAPKSRSALFLGLGTGTTVGAAASWPLERIDAVELVPEIVESLRWFDAINGGIRNDPRFAFHAADARRFVAADGPAYDLIVGDLFHPYVDGAAFLFTREHFRNVARRMNPGGLFVQWLPLFQLDPEGAGSIVRSFLDVFPRAEAVFASFDAERPALGLIGRLPEDSESALAFDLSAWREAPAEAKRLFEDAREIVALWTSDARALGEFAKGAPPNTDLAPALLFASPIAYLNRGRSIAYASFAELLRHRPPAPVERIVGPPAEKAEAVRESFARYHRAGGLFLEGDLLRLRSATDPSAGAKALAKVREALEVAPDFAPARAALAER